MFVLVVVAAPQLNYQSRLEAKEIAEVRLHRMLLAELRALEMTVAEARPQCAFRLGPRGAEDSCAMTGQGRVGAIGVIRSGPSPAR